MFRTAFKQRRCIIPDSSFYEWTGDEVLSGTILVSGASAWMGPYHDRMPVLLMPKQFDAWLKGEAGPEILRPAAESALREWIVSLRYAGFG